MRRHRPSPALLPRSGALFGDCKDAPPGPASHLIQTVHLLRRVYTILPHRAQLGFMAPGKARAGTPELAHVLPWSELAGDGRGCNCTGDGDGGWS